MPTHHRVVKRPRRKGEVASPLKAIRNHCLECMGYQAKEVKNCPAKECWLWPYRMGKRPKRGIE